MGQGDFTRSAGKSIKKRQHPCSVRGHEDVSAGSPRHESLLANRRADGISLTILDENMRGRGRTPHLPYFAEARDVPLFKPGYSASRHPLPGDHAGGGPVFLAWARD